MIAVVVGGTSGIGREAARELARQGHEVVVVGRNAQRGEAVVASLRETSGPASFLAADVSTHDGVRAAARGIADRCDRIDVLLHTTGVLTFADVRTPDGLHPFFAVNFLSRYHLTQLLLPRLRRSEDAATLLMTSNIPLTTKVDLGLFPEFSTFRFRTMTAQIQIGNQHYAAHLARAKPWLRAGVVNAGVARTGIWRETPWYVKALAATVGRLRFDPVERSASNPVAAATHRDWVTGTWWGTPGRFDLRTPIDLDPETTRQIVDGCRALTGV